MIEPIELPGLISGPVNRRCWLLYKALECLPLDRAIELARAADAFVTGSLDLNRSDDAPAHSEPTRLPTDREREPGAPATEQTPVLGTQSSVKRARLGLPPDRRDQLLEDLAKGATNAELATKCGLSSKQIQGVRIGSSREIAQRRDRLDRQGSVGDKSVGDKIAGPTASADEVVRYLRQQDDVVVPQQNGEFLLNGRLRLPLVELVARANRIRSRQGKPGFQVLGPQPERPEGVASANGHPWAWGKRTARSLTQPASLK
jgi:hypothetical protein